MCDVCACMCVCLCVCVCAQMCVCAQEMERESNRGSHARKSAIMHWPTMKSHFTSDVQLKGCISHTYCIDVNGAGQDTQRAMQHFSLPSPSPTCTGPVCSVSATQCSAGEWGSVVCRQSTSDCSQRDMPDWEVEEEGCHGWRCWRTGWLPKTQADRGLAYHR